MSQFIKNTPRPAWRPGVYTAPGTVTIPSAQPHQPITSLAPSKPNTPAQPVKPSKP